MRFLGHFGLQNRAIFGIKCQVIISYFVLGNFVILGMKCGTIFGIKHQATFMPGEFDDYKFLLNSKFLLYLSFTSFRKK